MSSGSLRTENRSSLFEVMACRTNGGTYPLSPIMTSVIEGISFGWLAILSRAAPEVIMVVRAIPRETEVDVVS